MDFFYIVLLMSQLTAFQYDTVTFLNVTGEQKICGRAREEQMSMTVERKLARQKKDVKTQGGGAK